MAAVVGLVVLTLCALLATGSWSVEAVRRTLVEREHGVALALWAGLSALAGLAALVTEQWNHQPIHGAVQALLLLSAVALAIGVGGAARLAALAWGPAPAAGEAVLVGASVTAVVWAAFGSAAPTAGAVTAAVVATVEFTAAALITRVPVVSPSPTLDRRFRPILRTAVAAIAALGVADLLTALNQLGTGVPAWAGIAARSAACLAAAAVPWVREGDAHPARAPRPLVRRLPYVLVAVAVLAQLAGALVRPAGAVSVALAALLIGGLAVVLRSAHADGARLRHDLDQTGTRLDALTDNASDVVLGIDSIGRVASANGAAARLLHRTPEAMIGLDVGELAVLTDRPALRGAVDDVVHGRRGAAVVDVVLAAPATGTAQLRLQGVAGGAVANLSDVTDPGQLRERLERLARFDEPTGLGNRTHLLDQISGWLRAGEPVTVLYCDLDGFKAVNDRFGHACGDDVLAQAARRLQNAAVGLPGETACVARVGGDEFVLALLRAPEEQLSVATERVLAAMRPTFPVADRQLRVGMSIGVASSTDSIPASLDPRDGADLLHRADVAMFAAKQAGRFQSARWDADMEAAALRRVDIAIGLRRALEERRLALAYQPLVRLSDGVTIGVEALIRIPAEDDAPGALAGLPDLVTPAELVAVAEDTGEITEMGHWVITEATLQAARWREAGHDILVTVNVSVRQMAADGFVEFVRDALATARLPAGSLVVEITEGQLLSEEDPAWGAVEQLRAMGVLLVIDDFGSGYSSLAYLRRMPVRGVKLDRALLDDLTTDPRARTLARAVIAAARALGLLVVAEGMETLEAARIVRDLGAYAGQGFALFQAMPADAVSAVLAGPPVRLGPDHRDRPPSRPDAASPPGPAAPAAPAHPPVDAPQAREGSPVPPGPMTPLTIDLSEAIRRAAGADLR